jgi:hypothetical protein
MNVHGTFLYFKLKGRKLSFEGHRAISAFTPTALHSTAQGRPRHAAHPGVLRNGHVVWLRLWPHADRQLSSLSTGRKQRRVE